jgi:signal transduction histidine kinase
MSGSTHYGVARDTTNEMMAKRVIENQHAWLSELIQSLPVPLVLADAKTGQIISASGEAGALINGMPRENNPSLLHEDLFFSDSAGNRLPTREWPRFRATRGETMNGEYLIWNTPFQRTHLQIWTRIVPAKYDHPPMILVMLQDIGPLKEKEVSLKEAVTNLRLERERRENFVSALAHDLRTPLTSAKMSVQLLARKGSDPSVSERLTTNVLKGLERIDNMIRDLLDANRIHAGEKLSMKVIHFDLVRLAKVTLDGLALIHPERFEIKASGKVFGDWCKPQLRRVIENLANNAVKYGSPSQTVTVFVTPVGKDHVSLTVHNLGNPIPVDEQASLFEQFRRSSAAQTSGKKGWGVGLTLVRGIVEAHGGKISVMSNLENGTTFSVVLPLVQAAKPN